jgi:hypothetical protein
MMMQFPKLKPFTSSGAAEPVSSSVYPVLQSGFISFTKVGLLRPPPFEDMMIKRVLMKDYMTTNLDQFYNSNVTDLYLEWLNNKDLIRTFEFREKLLQTAFRAFACDDVYKWFSAQTKLTSISPSHEVFLTDTLKFVLHDNRGWNQPSYIGGANVGNVDTMNSVTHYHRQLDIHHTLSFIEHSGKPYSGALNIDPFFINPLVTGRRSVTDNSKQLPSNIVDFICKWTSQVNGFTDLLLSLYVMFGARNDVVNVREKGL